MVCQTYPRKKAKGIKTMSAIIKSITQIFVDWS